MKARVIEGGDGGYKVKVTYGSGKEMLLPVWFRQREEAEKVADRYEEKEEN